MARTESGTTAVALMRPLIAQTLDAARAAETPSERRRHFTVALAMLRAADDRERAAAVKAERDLDDSAEYAARIVDGVDLDDFEARGELEALIVQSLSGPTWLPADGATVSYAGEVGQGRPPLSLHRACDAADLYARKLAARGELAQAAVIAQHVAEAFLSHLTGDGAELAQQYFMDQARALEMGGHRAAADRPQPTTTVRGRPLSPAVPSTFSREQRRLHSGGTTWRTTSMRG
ncbi:MAG: hypothetical protein ACOYNI_03155 [Acidimicrobiia bacterium]